MNPHDVAQRSRIVAAHHAGQSVTAIQQYFGLPREAVEQILADAGFQPPGRAPIDYAPQGSPGAGYGPPVDGGAASEPGPGHHSVHHPDAGAASRWMQAIRPPWPVMAAVLLVGLYAVLSTLVRLTTGPFGSYQAGGMVGSVVIALVAYLLWKGRRGAWIVTLTFGTLGIVGRLLAGDLWGAAVAAAVVLLLAIPGSARAWFRS